MTENVRKEFSLDYYQTLMETYWYQTAVAYKDLFVLQRKINRLQKKFLIEEGSKFDPNVYNTWLEERWIIYAEEYRDYFKSKNELIRKMAIVRFNTDEPIDEEVEKFETERGDDELDEMPDIETKKQKEEDTELEQLRKQYEEKFWKPVTNFKKNDAERIKNKLAE